MSAVDVKPSLRTIIMAAANDVLNLVEDSFGHMAKPLAEGSEKVDGEEHAPPSLVRRSARELLKENEAAAPALEAEMNGTAAAYTKQFSLWAREDVLFRMVAMQSWQSPFADPPPPYPEPPVRGHDADEDVDERKERWLGSFRAP